jgi:hypothetical protein
MAAVEVEALKKVRNTLVLARRRIVTGINTLGNAPETAELAASVEQLSKLQAGIEAIDRAIKDEGGLAPGSVGLPSATRG